jgi:hypothetical protein
MAPPVSQADRGKSSNVNEMIGFCAPMVSGRLKSDRVALR